MSTGLDVGTQFCVSAHTRDDGQIDYATQRNVYLALPVGTALLQRGRLGPHWTLAAMLAPFGLSLGWILLKAYPPPGMAARYPWSLEPIYVGLAASLLIYSAGWLRPRTEAAR